MGGAPKDRPSCFTSGFIHSVESRSPGRRTRPWGGSTCRGKAGWPEPYGVSGKQAGSIGRRPVVEVRLQAWWPICLGKTPSSTLTPPESGA